LVKNGFVFVGSGCGEAVRNVVCVCSGICPRVGDAIRVGDRANGLLARPPCIWPVPPDTLC